MKTVHVRYRNESLAVGKILCLGMNYPAHAKEMQARVPDAPIIFLKPSTAIIHDGDAIVRPRISNEMHHEVEMVLAIGKDGKDILPDQVDDYLLGYGVGLDMTLRDIQQDAKKRGLPWSTSKGFDTSAPISEIIPKEKIPQRGQLRLQCKVNGVMRQDTSISDMIFSPEEIICYVSGLFTLERGDLIFTGTPDGVGAVKPGDTIEAELVGHLRISHPVISG